MVNTLLLSLLVQAAPAADFVVAPGAKDTNPGTASRPFATLSRAQAAVHERVRAGLKRNVVVLLRGGTYELREPLRFGPEDSGTAEHSITYAAYPGEEVVLSGGSRIGGWRPAGGGLWSAEVPWAKAGFRQLVVNGRRAVRARTPNIDADPPFRRVVGASLADDRSRYTLSVKPEDAAAWGNIEDVEVVTLGNWEIVRKRLQSVDPATGTLVLAPPHAGAHDAIRPGPGRPYFLENAREFLDQPGEWYLDRKTGVLTYWPRPGEQMARATVVAPRLTRLLEVAGTPAQPVRNLHFRGIRFAHADWAVPEYGFNGIQASFHCIPHAGDKGWEWGVWDCIEPAVVWQFAHGCSLRDGALEYLDGVGIRLRKGCCDNVIEGNDVHAIGANGIMVGENLPDVEWGKATVPDAEIPRRNRVANNHVTACGLEDFGAVGIWVAFTDGTTVAHNLVHGVPYTGISVGFRWDEVPTTCRANVVEYNHVYDVLNTLCDGGCIYTLGLQPETVLRGNLLHDANRSAVAQGAPNNGVFFDQGSKGFLVEENVIYATSGEPIRFNMCQRDWHTWRNNHFGIPVAAEGKVGTALLCDGSTSCVEVPHAPELDAAELTAEAWVRVSEYPAGGDTRRWVVNKNDDEWTQGHWALVTDGAKVGAYLNIGGGRANQHEAWSDQGILTLNTWHHLAMTYDGKDLCVYLDGRQAAVAKVGKPRVPGGLPLAIGRRQDAYSYFKGAIDEVFVYGRALSPDEVAARFRAGGAAPAAGPRPAGHWGFEDLGESARILAAAREKAGLEPRYRARLQDRERR